MRPSWFRPPYGEHSPALARSARIAGCGLVTWDVDPRDWEAPDPATVATRVLGDVRPGSIVLLHEERTGASSDAIAAIVSGLRQAGLVPVTVSDLLENRHRG